jgi:TPP-dependent pyruvate/acetoin dehydrogenase alpha subunit
MADSLTREKRIDLLERMLLMRRFEEMVIHVAAAHKYIGRNHLYIGHEATGAVIMSLLGDGDLTYTTHRNHGHLIARGVDPGKALAEIMGRAGGLNGGRGGTWHGCDRTHGFQSTSAMVGGSVGLSIGGAYHLHRTAKGKVSVALFGDGALDEGISYEALNYASVFGLPLLFLCENNAKTGERPSSMLAANRLGDVPNALRIPSAVVDGTDVEALHATLSKAVQHVRDAGTPYFVEAKFERWPGSHQLKPEFTTGVTDVTMGWDESKIGGAHAEWLRKCDPIRLYVRALVTGNVMTKDEVLALDKKVNERMTAARAYAEASPFPKPETAVTGVFA